MRWSGQIQVKGPDAAAFVDYIITRDVHTLLPPMQARYVILCNQHGGVINDPVLLRVAEDEFWFSISDSDLLLWAQGVNHTGRFNVSINEIDVSPGADTGPQVGGPDGEDVRRTCPCNPVLRTAQIEAERSGCNDFAHRLFGQRSVSRYTCTTRCSTRTTYGLTS